MLMLCGTNIIVYILWQSFCCLFLWHESTVHLLWCKLIFPPLSVHPSPLFIDEDGKGPDSSPLDGWLDNLLSGVKGWTKNLYGLPACSLSDIIPLLYSPLSFISDMQSSIERHLQKVFQQ